MLESHKDLLFLRQVLLFQVLSGSISTAEKSIYKLANVLHFFCSDNKFQINLFTKIFAGYGRITNLDECNFHECVDKDEFESARMLRIRPPEGEVRLVSLSSETVNISNSVTF